MVLTRREEYASTLVSWRRWLAQCPASMTFAAITITLWTLAAGPAPLPRLVAVTALYRGRDLSDGVAWRLPISAFMPQTSLQFVWTLLMYVTVFVAVERRLGTTALVVIAGASHVFSTVAVDLYAAMADHPNWLNVDDYGSSCLIFGAVIALIFATRKHVMWVPLAVVLVVDAQLNSTMTVAEHVVSIMTAVLFIACLRPLPARQPRLRPIREGSF